MTPQALLERKAWAKEFEVEGFRYEGLDRGDCQSVVRKVSLIMSALRKRLVCS